MEGVARYIASLLGIIPDAPDVFSPSFTNAFMNDLITAKGNSIVIAGEHLPPAVHALVFAINEALLTSERPCSLHSRDPCGTTSILGRRTPRPGAGEFSALVAAMNSGAIRSLLILGGQSSLRRARRFRFSSGP